MVIEFQENPDEVVELNNPALQIYYSISLISLLSVICRLSFQKYLLSIHCVQLR